MRLANRGRLLLRTPGPFPFGTCICSYADTILSWIWYSCKWCISISFMVNSMYHHLHTHYMYMHCSLTESQIDLYWFVHLGCDFHGLRSAEVCIPVVATRGPGHAPVKADQRDEKIEHGVGDDNVVVDGNHGGDHNGPKAYSCNATKYITFQRFVGWSMPMEFKRRLTTVRHIYRCKFRLICKEVGIEILYSCLWENIIMWDRTDGRRIVRLCTYRTRFFQVFSYNIQLRQKV